MVIQLVVAIVVAVGVSALCSIIEAVLYSTPDSHIEVLAKSGKRAGYLLQRMKQDVHRPITAILTLNTVANTMGAAIAGVAAAEVFGHQYLALFSIAFTLAILLFSEIIPKTAGVAYARNLAPLIALPLHWMVTVFGPVIALCRLITRLVPASENQGLVSVEEVRAIAALSRKSGEIDQHQEKIINNIVELKRKKVRDVMTPRTVAYLLNEHQSVDEAMAIRQEWDRHSRIPLYNKDTDDIVGIILGKDILLAAADDQPNRRLASLMKPVHFVPETASLDLVFMDFIKRHSHLFVVVDEYGSVTGIISLEDIIEELVGWEIMDESDQTEDMRELARKKRQRLTNNAL